MGKTRLQLLFLLRFLSFRWRKVLLVLLVVRLSSNLYVVPDFGKQRRAHSSTKLSSFFALSLFLCDSVYIYVCVYVCLYLVSVTTFVPSKDSNSYAVCLLVIVFVAVFVTLLTRRPLACACLPPHTPPSCFFARFFFCHVNVFRYFVGLLFLSLHIIYIMFLPWRKDKFYFRIPQRTIQPLATMYSTYHIPTHKTIYSQIP